MKNIGINESENKTSNLMSFTDHLEELRQRILNCIFSILISIFFILFYHFHYLAYFKVEKIILFYFLKA